MPEPIPPHGVRKGFRLRSCSSFPSYVKDSEFPPAVDDSKRSEVLRKYGTTLQATHGAAAEDLKAKAVELERQVQPVLEQPIAHSLTPTGEEPRHTHTRICFRCKLFVCRDRDRVYKGRSRRRLPAFASPCSIRGRHRKLQAA